MLVLATPAAALLRFGDQVPRGAAPQGRPFLFA
jgi:hypothetical protein